MLYSCDFYNLYMLKSHLRALLPPPATLSTAYNAKYSHRKILFYFSIDPLYLSIKMLFKTWSFPCLFIPGKPQKLLPLMFHAQGSKRAPAIIFSITPQSTPAQNPLTILIAIEKTYLEGLRQVSHSLKVEALQSTLK